MIEAGPWNVESEGAERKSRTAIVRLRPRELVGHQNAVDHVDYAIGLEYIGNRHRCGPPFFVLQHDVLAILGRPQFSAFNRDQLHGSVACLDLLFQISRAQSARATRW